MIDPDNVPNVESEELLARYILQSSYIRSNHTLKPNAFVPHPHLELSVTRHRQAAVEELWAVGENVAVATGKTLYGRGDIQAVNCVRQNLVVKAAPINKNPNQADVSGWPADKPAQKIIALEIAATSKFVSRDEQHHAANRQ